MQRLWLDTHTFLWWVSEVARLTAAEPHYAGIGQDGALSFMTDRSSETNELVTQTPDQHHALFR